MSDKSPAERALEQGKGILRLCPTWVPREFCIPGRRIKLHPDDYYAMGGDRGGLDERWLSSTTKADNGPKTSPDEGLSFVVVGSGSGRSTPGGRSTRSSSTTRGPCPTTFTSGMTTPG